MSFTSLKAHTLIVALAFLFSQSMKAQELKTPTLDDLMWSGKNYAQLQPEALRTAFWGDRLLSLSNQQISFLRDAKGQPDKGGIVFSLSDVNHALGGDEASSALGTVHRLTNAAFPESTKPLALLTSDKVRFLYDWKSRQVVWSQPIPSGNIQWNDFNYAGRSLAFVRDWNLFILDRLGNEHTLSTDGSREVQYGMSVHRDEWGIDHGTFWSPSGTKLAFYRMDQTMVSDFPLVDINHRVAQLAPEKYPMAGMASHKVTVGVYDVTTRRTIWLQAGDPTDRYFTNITWSPDERTIYMIELPRTQDKAELVSYDAHTGERLRVLYTETNPKYVHPMHGITFLPWDSSRFIYQSERDGYNHLYLFDTEGHELSQLTSGPWVVTNMLGFNTKTQSVLIVSTECGHIRNNIYSVRVRDGKRTLLDNGRGIHRPTLSAGGQWILDTWRAPEVFRQYDLVSTVQPRPITLQKDLSPWCDYTMPTVEHGTLTAADDSTELHWRMVKPVGFNPSRKYPTVVYVYGGPGLRNVEESWNYAARPWEYHMANRGYLLFILDNRGSKDRGFDFESCTFRHLGDEEMRDQMRGVEFLRSLPYVDQERMGVHGWSFGGFMTTNLMCTYPDVFKAGVAGGPVIDWKYYEVMYGERYMDSPQENPDGYRTSSLLPKAGNLKGRLQIIVGYNDPTCVLQHSMSFLRACEDAGTQPDYFVYPGQGHNMNGSDAVHLHERITRYFDDYLR